MRWKRTQGQRDEAYRFLNEVVSDALAASARSKAYTVIAIGLPEGDGGKKPLLRWLTNSSLLPMVMRWRTVLCLREFALTLQTSFDELGEHEYQDAVASIIDRLPEPDDDEDTFKSMTLTAIEFCNDQDALEMPNVRKWAKVIPGAKGNPEYEDFIFGLVIFNSRLILELSKRRNIDQEILWRSFTDSEVAE
jgi:hypothetical protein